ncbi:MAG: glutamine--tRNA ligase, partial [Christensenellaceae bacterium]|nr:glutamine--tRNA ligase [Christensenellaceae bacterium]
DNSDFIANFNKNSMIKKIGYMDKYLENTEVGDTFQFLRLGYFTKDKDSTPELPVFNRVVGLRDTFAKKVLNN